MNSLLVLKKAQIIILKNTPKNIFKNKEKTKQNINKTKQKKTKKNKQNEYIKGIKQEKRQPVLNHE